MPRRTQREIMLEYKQKHPSCPTGASRQGLFSRREHFKRRWKMRKLGELR